MATTILLDGDYDFQLNSGSYISEGLNKVSQDINVQLSTVGDLPFLGEDFGIDYKLFNRKLESQDAITSYIADVIQNNVEGVKKCYVVQQVIDNTTDELTVEYVVETIYGNITINQTF